MKEEFVPYELAVKLKQLGYDEEGFGAYNVNGEVLPLMPYTTESKAILFQQAFRWFRKKEFLIDVTSLNSDEYEFYIQWSFAYSFLSDIYKTYEEVELACLNKLIEIVELNKL
jgi:hypothetical protein